MLKPNFHFVTIKIDKKDNAPRWKANDYTIGRTSICRPKFLFMYFRNKTEGRLPSDLSPAHEWHFCLLFPNRRSHSRYFLAPCRQMNRLNVPYTVAIVGFNYFLSRRLLRRRLCSIPSISFATPLY